MPQISSDETFPLTLQMGAHLSSAQGYEALAKTAHSIGAHTFAFFTRNPRGGKAKDINPADLAAFESACKIYGIHQFVAHGSYTINPASAKPEVREFAHIALADDLARMEMTPGQLFNMHPGSHTGQGVERGVELVAECLNNVITLNQTTTVLLETMAGKGTEIGRSFEELRAIIDCVEHDDKVGVCLDTCHIWDGGYDIVDHLDDVLEEFDTVIGLDRLRALHINDSKNPLGSHKDRHAKIGEGQIGSDALLRVVYHPQLLGLPCILETPNELDGWAKEIAFFVANKL